MASRAVALSYAARRLRQTGALQELSRPDLPRLTRRRLLGDDDPRTITIGGMLGAPEIPQLEPVDEYTALGIPAYGQSVALLCNAIAGTDWYARRLDKQLGLKLPLPEQPGIVTNPSPLQTLWNYRWAVGEDLIQYGNSFGLNGPIDSRTGRPGWVVPLPVHDVWIMVDPADGTYEWVMGGETFTPDEILHISAGNRSGFLLGRGVLNQYQDWLTGVRAAEDYSRDVFAAGALPPAVVTSNQATTPEKANELKRIWRDIVRTREPVILPNGTVVTPIVGNAEQAQLVEARQWNAHEAANAVGVPYWKLGLPGPRMTYQNIEQGDIDFTRDSVDRYGRAITDAFTKWMLPAGTELVWDYDSRMRADQKTTQEILVAYVQAGILTAAEARAKLGRPPLPAEDVTPGATQSSSEEAAAGARADEAAIMQLTPVGGGQI